MVRLLPHRQIRPPSYLIAQGVQQLKLGPKRIAAPVAEQEGGAPTAEQSVLQEHAAVVAQV